MSLPDKGSTWNAIREIALQVLVTLMATEIAGIVRDVLSWLLN
ncbi:hypothetical protein [Corynebacterium mastitidis]|nr:hypothetical protein [Corynebacterium mastitidis]